MVLGRINASKTVKVLNFSQSNNLRSCAVNTKKKPQHKAHTKYKLLLESINHTLYKSQLTG